MKRSQSECSARYKRAPGACTYCADLNTSAIRAHALLVTHRVDQVDAPNHRFTHRSYEKHRQRAHRMQQALSLLVGIHSSFNVGRALEGSLQLCRLPHASTPRESSPARQRLTLRKAVSRETKAHPFHTGLDLISASYVVVDTEVGSRHIQPRPHRCTHLRRGSLLIEGRTWCQRADDTREILVSCELDSDTPLLRSTCHLDARIEGVGKTR